MSKKQKIIFLVTFVIIILISLSLFFWFNKPEEKTRTGETPWYQQFNPFGSDENNTQENVFPDGGIDINTNGPQSQSSRFFKVTDFAISGFITQKEVVQREGPSGVESKDVLVLKYVERKNGHIHKMFLDDKKTDKVSNSTIPAIYEALFDNKGETVVYRYLSENGLINSFLATLGKPFGQYLPSNITDMSVSLDRTKLFYLVENNNTVSGTVKSFGLEDNKNVFNHQFTEWLSDWDSNNNVYLTTKASYDANGSVYLLNQNNKTLTKIFGGIKGLTTKISPNGKKVLYSYYSENGPRLAVYSTTDNKSTDLDYYGLPEKCVWSMNNTEVYCAVPKKLEGDKYPDVWYQGAVSFDDFFIKINTINLDTVTIADSTKETPVDATYLQTDQNETFLFFINKKDYTLWQLNIK